MHFGGRLAATMLFAALFAAGPCFAQNRADPLNFVVILVDDLGFADVGANNPGTFYRTPHIDALARDGVRFTNGYVASPVCSPTRYSLLTGRYPTRVDATNYFSGRRAERFEPAPLHDRMPREEVTLAESLQEAGYRTAFLGKWHLGPSEEYWPKAQGFEINVGGHSAGSPRSYFSPYRNPNLLDGPEGQYLTRRLGDEAVALLERFQDDSFLLYLSFYSVHIPLQAPAGVVEKYRSAADSDDPFGREEQVWPTDEVRRVRIRQSHPTYAAMVEIMDAQVGRVVDKLEELGIDDRTAVFFLSDNGGLSTAEGLPTSNLPLRAGKGWLYEGGIRIPWIVRVPGAPRGRTEDVPVISTDLYPTILDLASLPPRPAQHLDGMSIVPLLRGGTMHGRSLYWHYPHYSNQGGFPGAAVRSGRYKLIERFEDGSVQLYDLQSDLSERNDLSEEEPARVESMRQQLHAWYEEVDASFLRARADGPKPWRPDE